MGIDFVGDGFGLVRFCVEVFNFDGINFYDYFYYYYWGSEVLCSMVDIVFGYGDVLVFDGMLV